MKGERTIAALVLGVALILAAASGDVRAQPAAAAIASDAVDKATMDREREISRHLSAADRERARKLFEDGFALGIAKKLDDARKSFEEGLAIDPADAQANYMLGYILLQQDRFDDAPARLARTIYFAPKSSEAISAKAAMTKLAALNAGMPLKPTMSAGCRPLVENFIAAAQKNDGPAAKAGYDALHDAGGCGIADGPLLTADEAASVSASVAAQGASGPTAAGTAATFVRYIGLGLKIGQELEEAREEFAAEKTASSAPSAGGPPLAAAANGNGKAGAIKNPFAGNGSKNPFVPVSLPSQAAAGSPVTGKPPAKTGPASGAPGQTPAQAVAGQMPASCGPGMQKYLNDVGGSQAGSAGSGAAAVNSYQQLTSSDECRDAMKRLAADNALDLPDRRMTPLTRSAFSAAFAKDPNAPLASPSSGPTASQGDDYDPQEVLQFGIALLNLAGGAASLANAMHGGGGFAIPTTNFNSLAAPIIRNGVGQGAPAPRPPVPQPPTSRCGIPGCATTAQ